MAKARWGRLVHDVCLSYEYLLASLYHPDPTMLFQLYRRFICSWWDSVGFDCYADDCLIALRKIQELRLVGGHRTGDTTTSLHPFVCSFV